MRLSFFVFLASLAAPTTATLTKIANLDLATFVDSLSWGIFGRSAGYVFTTPTVPLSSSAGFTQVTLGAGLGTVIQDPKPFLVLQQDNPSAAGLPTLMYAVNNGPAAESTDTGFRLSFATPLASLATYINVRDHCYMHWSRPFQHN